jgi:hypothetical protein
VVYTDEEGRPHRTRIRRGQSVDAFNLSDEALGELKAAVGFSEQGYVRLFTELEAAPGWSDRHAQAGTIGNNKVKEQKVEAEKAAAELAQVEAEVPAAPVEEKPKAAKAPAKKKSAAKKTKK